MRNPETYDQRMAVPPSNDQLADQTDYDRGNKAVVEALARRGPQVPVKSANDAAFQPFDGRVVPQDTPVGDVNLVPFDGSAKTVGDMVSGMPRGGEANRNTVVDLGADMATGGEPDGPKSSNEPGAQNFYRSIKDYPGGQGGQGEPLEPTSYKNP